MSAALKIVDKGYVLHEKLGEGGMGAVFRATRRMNGSVVALKIVGQEVLPNVGSDSGARFTLRMALIREFQTLSSLHHPNVIQVIDYGFDEQLGPFYTMELLDEPQTLLEAGAGRSVRTKVLLLAELLRALAYLHRRGIIHRDLKPSNVLYANGAVKVVDFGIATNTPQRAEVAGTLEYMAPELFAGQPPSVASDLYAVGVLAHQLLTDRLRDHARTRLPSDPALTETFFAPESSKPGYQPTREAKSAVSEVAVSPGAMTRPLPPTTPDLDASTRDLRTGIDPGASTRNVPVALLERAAREPLVGSEIDGLEGPIAPIVRRLLSPSPRERHGSALEVLAELGAVVAEHLPIETAETRESFLQASELIGRGPEMETLAQALDRVRRGQGGGFLLGGESGVGKSRLTSELRTLALVKGATVATGQAVTDGGSSHQIWIPVLRALCLRAELGDALASVLKDLIPDIAELLDREVPDPPALSPVAAVSRLDQAIESLFRRQTKPTVVLLEDLQWASEDSVKLLDRLSRLSAELPLLFVGNYRDDEAAALPERLPAMKLIKLQRLSVEHVAALSASMLGPAGKSPELVGYLHRETEGNVFFLVEVVRALAEQAGQLDRVGQMMTRPEHLLTGGIQRIAARRVDRVPEGDDRRLLELAATQGRQLDLTVLDRAMPGVDLRRWLLVCANAAVLESQAGEWRFSHDKLREAILDRIDPAARPLLHARVAEAIEQVYSGAALDARSAALARHFDEAGEPEKAWTYGVRAGDIATRLCAYGEARRQYAAALITLDKLPISVERRRRRVDTLLRQVYTTLVADTAEQNFARMTDAKAQLEAIAPEAELALEDRMRLARVHYFIGRIHFYRGQAREALGCYQKVLPIGMESGDPELIALPACLIGTALLTQGNMIKAEPLLLRSIEPLEKLGEPFEWFRAVGYHGASLIALGRYREGIAELERVLARAREIGQPSLSAASNLMTGSSYMFSGDWLKVIAHENEVLELAAKTGDKLHLSLAWSYLGWAKSHLGDHVEAATCRARGQEIAQAMGGRLMLSDWFDAGDAVIALNAGRLDEALERARAVSAASEAAGLLFSRGVAERVWGEVLDLRGEADEADAHMATSIAVLESGGNLLQAVRSRIAWALQWKRRGDVDTARVHFDAGCSQYRASGCTYALTEAELRWARG